MSTDVVKVASLLKEQPGPRNYIDLLILSLDIYAGHF